MDIKKDRLVSDDSNHGLLLNKETKKEKNKTVNFKNCLGVFQGGGCKALAFVGAYSEARARGVNFSEVAGTSAGSIFAALIAAGATPEYLENLIDRIDFNNFNKPADKDISSKYGYKKHQKKRNFARKVFKNNKEIVSLLDFLDNLGLYSSEELESWLNDELRNLLNIENKIVKFRDLKLPLHVIATDIINQKQKVWNYDTSPDESVAFAIRCSCSIPLYFQPVNMEYVDGGLVSNLPSFSLNDNEGHFEKILCFTLHSKPENIDGIKSYLESIAGAVVDGAVQIQEMLQHNTYNIVIKDLPVTTTGFDLINNDLVQKILTIGKEAAANFFNKETIRISEKKNSSHNKLTKDYILNSVVMEDVDCHEHIYLCFSNTKHVYGLFPTIFSWLIDRDIRVTFITKKIDVMNIETDEIEHENYRRGLIKRFGIHLIERDTIPFDAFIFKGENSPNDKAIFLYKKTDLEYNIGHGAIYDGKYDLYVIKSLLASLNITEEDEREHDAILENRKSFNIEKISPKKHIKLLHKVSQYKRDVTIQEKSIELSNSKLMTKYVKSYKYNQIAKFNGTLKKYGVNLFDPCLIKFSDGLEFLITPIIVEKYDDDFIVIKGNSRLSYAHRELGLTNRFNALVASGVVSKLPSPGSYPVSDCIITTINKEGTTRYENWSYPDFRSIEETIRCPKDFLGEGVL
ncbi:TPA: patatin-like phospholipase family protein [Photobacterium damselae]